MYRMIKKYTPETREFIRQGQIPKCNFSGQLTTLRLSDESFLIMCGPCKQDRLAAYPELIKFQGRRAMQPTAVSQISSNESGL